MNFLPKRVARMVPAGWRRWWRRRFGWRWLIGDYATWAEARAASAGYEDGAVLQQVVAAARAVRDGTALWDRDGATFTVPEINRPLVAALRAVAADHGGRLEVVDFGGGLGSTWRQHRLVLGDLAVRWRVVEQPHFVTAGAEFADEVLSFHGTLRDACAVGGTQVLLCSGVLQYLEHPDRILGEALRLAFSRIVVDRTPFAVDGQRHLVIQRVPPALGGGSYPSWLFGATELLAPLLPHYRLAESWPAFDDLGPRAAYRGCLLVRQPGSLARCAPLPPA